MCGSLLSKFTLSNKVAPAPRKDSLETNELPGKAELSDEPAEPAVVEISSPIEKNFNQYEDTGIKVSERTRPCAEDCKSESKDKEKAVKRIVESAAVAMTAGFPVARPHELPPLYRPTVDIKKVKEVVAKDMARLKKKAQAERKLAKEKLAKEKLQNEVLVKEKLKSENLAKKKLSKEELIKEKLPKERLVTEKLAKQQVVIREKMEATQSGQASSSNTVATKPISSARTHSILLGKTKSAIAFEVLVGSKRRETILLSARVPRCLRRFDSPPLLTADVLAAKQLAAREKRLKELERVRDCARACAQSARRPHPMNRTCMHFDAEQALPSKDKK